ncbi:hypothetical protein GCM10011352_02110 [Marinobacterium zhoushanense]|uniref:Uncharacterized protein n=1 Tax=Marinobacterium zhoushanense TaxID=1679163 RepID=A0ABQ1JW49_9GAMM|nr:hypothetical protein [Marinobacterium zhoushanense]GGB80002.1 hypothetical protein GCM10011352_02110 [Marinobacterium zhoushanense]
MKISKPLFVALFAVPILLLLLGTGGYFGWHALRAQHDENRDILQKFGFEIMPANPYTESTGVLGQKQLPATFAEDDLTPVEKVIHGLMKDKERLLKDNEALQQVVEQLKQQIADLEHYKAVNEQFAPETLEQELARTRGELEAGLRALPEAKRFSDFWINMMSGAALTEYRRFVDANRMLLDEPTRKRLVEHELINYAFCIGNAVEIAANSAAEVRSIARWLEQPETTRLPSALSADLNTVLPPCQKPLREQLNASLSARGG